MRAVLNSLKFLTLGLLLLSTQMNAAEVWSGPAFAADAAALRHAADAVKAGKNSEATLLLNDLHFSFDATGRLVENRHLIYRIENQQGIENWAESSGRWESWHQAKPGIKARVITADGKGECRGSRKLRPPLGIYASFEAIDEFKARVPDLARGAPQGT